MILLFVVGYTFIALEHKVKVDKSAIALLMCGAIWTVFSLWGHDSNISHEMVDHLGDTCEILVFLIGAMTIVDLIDTHGGFNVITDHITTRNKHKLMWLLAIITFFMSAALDNMTTTIIMVMLLRRIIADQKERWIFASLIVIAANSGGAWSPIGDVTTIMLWMRGNVTAAALMGTLFVPCIVSVIIPTAIAMRYVGNEDAAPVDESAFEAELPKGVGPRLSKFILVTGVLSLLFVPVFKSITHLPPYMGMMVSLGVMWVLTEIIYDRKRGIEESIKCRVSKVLKHIDMPTILFFLGILMSVAALQSAARADRRGQLARQAGARGLHDRGRHRRAFVGHRQRTAGGRMYGHVSGHGRGGGCGQRRSGLHAVVRAGRTVLAPADLLRRRGRQSADYRFGGGRRGDGAGKDQLRVVLQENHAAGVRRLSVGHSGHPARTPADRAMTGEERCEKGRGGFSPAPFSFTGGYS